jgi:meso-butanediol dehydrogenase / (S,S)-butanediol dehydrogenase / diacetyl reductase
MRVRDKVAIVTGGASGIGAATARRLSEEGARVVILDVNPPCQPPFEGAVSMLVDVRSEAEVQSAIEEVARRFGCIDALINNAGIAIRKSVGDADETSWKDVLDVNLKGAFLCSKHALRFMPRFGSIVHMSSVVGITGVNDRAAYSSAKGALVALARNMAVDYASRNIRVNCVCPGFVRTPFIQGLISDPEREEKIVRQHPLGRLGEPEDIANAVLFLISDEASWITGHALIVDGGFSIGHVV